MARHRGWYRSRRVTVEVLDHTWIMDRPTADIMAAWGSLQHRIQDAAQAAAEEQAWLQLDAEDVQDCAGDLADYLLSMDGEDLADLEQDDILADLTPDEIVSLWLSFLVSCRLGDQEKKASSDSPRSPAIPEAGMTAGPAARTPDEPGDAPSLSRVQGEPEIMTTDPVVLRS